MSPKQVSARVRGIGVAVITSMSTRLALGAERQALVHAEAVLLVDHREAEIVEDARSSWNSAWVPTTMSIAPAGQGRQRRAALRGLVAAGEQRERAGPAAASGARRSKCWRARISVGAISAAWRPASTAPGHGEQRHRGLAGADIALQQAQHAPVGGDVAADLGDAPAAARR